MSARQKSPPTSPSAAPQNATPQASESSFSEAIQELEAILQRVDSDATDIDRLAEELQRATELLELCRGKIRKAEVEVNQIVQKLGTS